MSAYSEYKPSGVPWLGAVPKHWEMKKVKYLASNIADKTSSPPAGIRYVGMEHVESWTGRFVPDDENLQTEAESTVSRFSEGDVLFGKLRPYLAKAVVADSDGVCTTELLVLRAETVIPRYLLRAVLIEPFIREVNASTFGAKMPRADWGFIGDLSLPEPPESEQEAIAAYLDTETARIDALIAEKERLIETLVEYRQATISEVITKGLNPSAPMKATGVLWLGDVPEHWNVQAVKRLSPVKRGASPRPIADPIYFDNQGEYCWVRIEDVTRSSGVLLESEQRLSDLGSSLSVKLEPGSLFLSIAGSVGKSCITGIKACIHDGFVYFPYLSINPRFLFCIFESGLAFQGLGKMGTQLNLNTQTVGDIKVAIPPESEMDEMLSYLDEKLSQADVLLAHVNSEIGLLRELRSTTITDAVLGRIKVC